MLAGTYVAGGKCDGSGCTSNVGGGGGGGRDCSGKADVGKPVEELKAGANLETEADRSGVPSLSMIGTSMVELPVKLRTGNRLLCFFFFSGFVCTSSPSSSWTSCPTLPIFSSFLSVLSLFCDCDRFPLALKRGAVASAQSPPCSLMLSKSADCRMCACLAKKSRRAETLATH